MAGRNDALDDRVRGIVDKEIKRIVQGALHNLGGPLEKVAERVRLDDGGALFVRHV